LRTAAISFASIVLPLWVETRVRGAVSPMATSATTSATETRRFIAKV
jgi:hypothetical protein